ncbi:hypothetical protein SRHO_G00258910 [Serrasalmus rhombeus]
MGDNKSSKIFNDSVHGHIEMPPLLVKIIDTPEFQRLRNIKQLGGGYYVFPGASHNRFEHSIGVAHLAGQLLKSLRAHQDLDITEQEELCVQIAGLCHDLGHGPFSHAFEVFMKEVKPNLNWKHEDQSVKMFKEIIKKAHIKEDMAKEGLTTNHFKLIEHLIHPPEDIPKDKCFLYEIVSNPRTGIDVDKMDYFIRDCHHLGMKCNFSHERYMKFARVCTDDHGERQICMRDKEAMNMYELFHVRTLLHHNAYQHRVTKVVELMIVDALKAAEKTKVFKISAALEKTEDFMTLTDDILQQINRSTEPQLEKAREIIDRILNRDLYRFIGEETFGPNELKHMDDKKWQETLAASLKKLREKDDDQCLNSVHFKTQCINFNYGKQEKDPIKFLRFYSKDDPVTPVEVSSLSKKKVSFLLPQKFAETKVMLFYKGLPMKHVKKLWEELQTHSALDEEETTSAVEDEAAIYENLTGEIQELSTSQQIINKISENGRYNFFDEKTFKSEEVNHLNSDEKWKAKLKTWFVKVKEKLDLSQQPFTVNDFKLVSYSQSPSLTNGMLFYKGIPKEELENFWKKVQN